MNRGGGKAIGYFAVLFYVALLSLWYLVFRVTHVVASTHVLTTPGIYLQCGSKRLDMDLEVGATEGHLLSTNGDCNVMAQERDRDVQLGSCTYSDPGATLYIVIDSIDPPKVDCRYDGP